MHGRRPASAPLTITGGYARAHCSQRECGEVGLGGRTPEAGKRDHRWRRAAGQIIAGVSGSLRSLGALRAGVAETRSASAELLAVLAWAPAGGRSCTCERPGPLLRLREQEACERLHGRLRPGVRRPPRRRGGPPTGGARPAGPGRWPSWPTGAMTCIWHRRERGRLAFARLSFVCLPLVPLAG
jgi:hypothetical protein